MTVGDICTRSVVTATPNESVVDAARRMRDRHVGDLVVVDEKNRPVGLVTDRDIVVSAVAQSADKLDALTVGDLMTPDPVVGHARETVDDVLRRMRLHGIRRLPIVSSVGQLIGIVTFDDMIRQTSEGLRELVSLVAGEHERERAERDW
jgi:CBS domain-containing protein